MGISARYFCLNCGAVFTTEFDRSQHLEKEAAIVHFEKASAVEQVAEQAHDIQIENDKSNSTDVGNDEEQNQLSEFLRILYAA